MSAITFNDEGLVIRQVDLYDGIEAVETVIEAKLGPAGDKMRQVLGWVGPKMRESTRAFYRLFEQK